MEFRKLTSSEITRLEQQGCRAESWENVLVSGNFQPWLFHEVRFSGHVTIGDQEVTKENTLPAGHRMGIYRAAIHNSAIGNRVWIENCGIISNYEFSDEVIIQNTGSLEASGTSDFGFGTRVEVLNEAGGREVLLFDRLSAPVAYLLALYREEPAFTERLTELIQSYCATKKASRGYVGKGAKIIDCRSIHDVRVGDASELQSVILLENGSIISKPEAPAKVGAGVIARNFIVHTGSVVDSGALLLNCFVGQGVQMGKQFSAENSLFFANCESFHSEACSIFAGPYTVTHHKSTLLIASLYSFFNAGSGTNHSNHMYKLGPVHQGIFDRGSKTGSFAYLLLPSRIGPYSVVIGKHFSNFDASDFPFSYIREEDGKTVLYPGMNLFTVGTRRDAVKWPARDRRKDPEKLDLIHFDLFSPLIAGRCMRTLEIMQSLAEKASPKQEFVQYKGTRINRLMLSASRKYYAMAIQIFFGQQLVRRIQQLEEKNPVWNTDQLFQLQPQNISEAWCDLCGLLAPAGKVEELKRDVQERRLSSVEELERRLGSLHQNYSEFCWSWTVQKMQKQYGLTPEKLDKQILVKILEDWKNSSIQLNQMVLADAKKEFDSNSRIGYGIDGDEKVKEADFMQVRGSFDHHKFVKEMEEENQNISSRAEALIRRIRS